MSARLINYKKKRELIKTIIFYNNRRLIFHLRNYIVKKYN